MSKKNKNIAYVSVFFSLICLISCSNSASDTVSSDNEISSDSLHNHFKGLFRMGAAINEQTILGFDKQSKEIVTTEFNSITPENSLKWMYLQPKLNQFDFSVADKYVQLGLQNNMYIVGHALVWHSQLADFMQNIQSSTEMNAHVQNHVNTVVSRYKGKINAWDVVNEAFNEDGTLRTSVFYNQMGEDYIDQVFQWAAKADPDADLIYNDYNVYKPSKRAGILRLVEKLKSNGTKISGVGVQAHWDLNSPSLQEIEQIILDISSVGVPVSFTELDISVLPSPWELVGAEVSQNFSELEGDPTMNPYPNGLPDAIQNQLAKRYEDIFKLFIKHKDKISRVTFWGVMDKHSWLNDWPIKGRTNYPLLFDRNYQPKKAYQSVIHATTTD